jgi:UDP-glucose 4-epimerase
MKIFLTGGAGFIGSHLADRLLQDEHELVVYDNLSTGQERFLEEASKQQSFKMIRGDLLDSVRLKQAMSGCSLVFHFAANADVRFGPEHPDKDLEQNSIVTFNVLEAMRATGIRKIVFASTGSVYGEPAKFPTPETDAFPIQTSFYGASKLAGEGLIEAYCEAFDFQSYIFRFVSILGERYTHGHIFDFVKSLRSDPMKLRVLGDGHQKKSYLYVGDCIEAVLLAVGTAKDRVNIFNLGTDEYCEVNHSIDIIIKYLGLQPELEFTGGNRGWVGDSPFIFLDCKKIRNTGWRPKLSITEGIVKTLDYLTSNPWVLDIRN